VPGAEVSPERIDADVRSVAARSAHGIYDVAGGRCRLLRGMRDGAVVPVASAFKLWILDALAREVAAGRAEWDEELPVRDALRSDPSGEVHGLDAGTPLSLRRHAELMISISDNTAADHLLWRVGRARVEATLAAVGVSAVGRDIPLLSTAEMARLKFVSPAAGEDYLALGSVAGRRRALARLARRVPFPWERGGDPSAVIDTRTPRLIDELEWFATPRDMCRTMADLAQLAATPGLGPVGEILSINPGLPPDLLDAWETARFKGGSEPGVLAFVHGLTGADGRERVVVLGWSDPTRPIAPSPAVESAWRGLLDRARSLE
jgi:hypothetical protein